jgi:pectate lyase
MKKCSLTRLLKKCIFNICNFLSLLLVYLLLIQFKVSEDKETGIEPVLIPAFPGAEGFGSTTAGGRGGRVIEVTNLNAAGPGSFLEACEASGPRIVVFRTGGMINTTNTINIRNPFITIAGQTAPGSGICIGGGAGLNIATHDVVIRGIRVRVGDNPAGPSGDNRDGIGVANESVPPYNIILDHCSVSWAIDENIQLWYACHDVTIQWCITSEALDSSLHGKGPHSKGMIIGPDAEGVSIHHNLFAHNVERNPLISVDTKTEVINNVVYNWKSRGLNLGNCYPEHGERSNVIANFFKKGPDSNENSIEVSNCWINAKVYMKDNIGPGRPDETGDAWGLVNNIAGQQIKASGSVIESSGLTVETARKAYSWVLQNAGAVIPERDTVDVRIINDVRNGTGSIIDSQDEVDGWPEYDKGTSRVDTDHDGIPDEWEKTHRLNPGDYSDCKGRDLSSVGYSNIEVYINELLDLSSTGKKI